MNLGFKMDGDPEHENLVIAAATQIAMVLRDSLVHEVGEAKAEDIAESITFDLAQTFDSAFIEVNGKKYRPRLAFIAEDDSIVPGAEKMDFMHEYASAPLMDEDSFTIVKSG